MRWPIVLSRSFENNCSEVQQTKFNMLVRTPKETLVYILIYLHTSL